MTLRGVAITALCATFASAFAPRRVYSGCSCTQLPSLGDFSEAEILAPKDEMSQCMAFLDANRDGWDVETSNVAQLEKNTAEGLPTVQVMRLSKPYSCTYDNKQAPFLRIVAFLPHVETSTVHEYVTDVEKRRSWDTNYQMFTAMPGPPSSSSLSPSADLFASVTRPLSKFITYHRTCVDGVCTRTVDTQMVRLDSQWMVHRLGSPFLSKLGVAERFFAYRRSSTAWHSMTTAERVVAYDILYGGAPDLVRQGKATSPDVKAFLDEAEAAKPGCKPVQVNYQHILLLPISTAKRQLVENDLQGWKQLSTMASLVDLDASKVFHDCLMDSSRLASSPKEESGTLFVITSANCADVPAAMPLWVQKKISSTVAFRTYETLQKACVGASGPHDG